MGDAMYTGLENVIAVPLVWFFHFFLIMLMV